MKKIPDLGFWKLWNISFGFFGVQIAYALQSANISRIFSTLGADPHSLSYFWILPPLAGIIVQPIIGALSDRTWTRFGRRIPYLFAGALVAVCVMCLLPNAGSFGMTVSAAMVFGLISLMFLDTSINMAMQPFKMMVGDMVNEKQKGLAYSIQSFLCNAGSLAGYLFPFIFAAIGISNIAPKGVIPDSVIYSFYIGAFHKCHREHVVRMFLLQRQLCPQYVFCFSTQIYASLEHTKIGFLDENARIYKKNMPNILSIQKEFLPLQPQKRKTLSESKPS
jgi:maltose/moltooligosaccharide transporter